MEIFKLLDRFELLYPQNDSLEDLRRAYIDRDIHSILRLVTTENKEDIRKLVMYDNTYSLWRLLNQYVDTNFVYTLKSLHEQNIDFDQDCFSRGQLQSKLWLVDELKRLNLNLGTVFLCAGWYGALATMIFESGLSVEKIRSFDIDPSTAKIAEIFNKPWVIDNWKFKPVVQDIHEIRFEEHIYDVLKKDGTTETLYDTPNTVINTSCEHIDNFKDWYEKIPSDTLVIMQTNDYFDIKEHVNCSSTLEDFSEKTPMTQELFSGELQLSKYKRFMRIGYR